MYTPLYDQYCCCEELWKKDTDTGTPTPAQKIMRNDGFVINTMIFQFGLSFAKSNLFGVCSVSSESSSPFIHYPIFNHFSPALYLVFHHEQ